MIKSGFERECLEKFSRWQLCGLDSPEWHGSHNNGILGNWLNLW
jgi:hypothetical protein